MLAKEVAEMEVLLQTVPLEASPRVPITWRSLPNKGQLVLLACCRLSEPLSNTCLLPYTYFLLKSILSTSGTASISDISTLSGILIAAFPLAQCVSSVPWSHYSDKYGRKPIILLALFLSIISNLAFGFSRSLPALFFWRVLAGLANGNIGMMRTMTAEIVKERKYQTRAFLLLPLVFNSGMVIGLALGGCLADPVINLPWLFGPNGLFNAWKRPEGVQWAVQYPYALPALANAMTLAITFVLAVLGMRETLEGKEHTRDYGLIAGSSIIHLVNSQILRRRPAGYTSLRLDDCLEASADQLKKPIQVSVTDIPIPTKPPPSIWTRRVVTSMITFALLPLHNAVFIHLFPVYLSMPQSDESKRSFVEFGGGLGLASPSVGLWLAAIGVCGILLQMFIYPRIQARLGTLGTFRIALFTFPFVYLLTPYLSLLPHSGFGRWAGIAIILGAQVMARTIAIPSTVILLTEAAPAKNVLGKVHGTGNMLSSLSRAVGPALGGLIFAWGIEHSVVGVVWWLYLTVVALAALAWSYTMKAGDKLMAVG